MKHSIEDYQLDILVARMGLDEEKRIAEKQRREALRRKNRRR